ncbi:probable LRR receptor-like serine/threonine-protein kinase At3g47570 [Eucalyptus grandis]|uniref:probable LRR receptor-like serine/threonine-protein kinase At3g47570 n=1 Tax=Eucalyptus grandis TaxID=71139 RepID=UPI00192E94A6|nr:probable LRR receptor-like serine/threonine-protein kinase At3g47570 [Eucalyptus grandis]
MPTVEKLNWLQRISASINYLGSGPQVDMKFLESINSTSLNLLAIGGNNFEGTLPESIGNFSSQLSIMSMEYNQLSGNIPPSIGNLRGLELLRIDNNKFTGNIPDTIGNLIKLKRFRAHMNKLTRNIPSTIGNLTELIELSLKGNNLQGSIPPRNISSFLRSLNGLQYLDLSSNNFSGLVPTFLEKFQLQYLNLSFNNFEGEVLSKGVFLNTSATSLKGNDKLCGGMSILDLPSCSTSKGKHGSSISRSVIIIVTCGIVAALIPLVLLMTFYWLRRKKSEAPLETPSIRGFQQVSYEDLVKATDGFSSSNFIGMGGFGSVYKGNLADENKIVAVKVFNLKQQGASKSFTAECEVLKNIRHRNLVKILTACSSVDFQGNEFKALVYDFMENDSLEEWLHPYLAPNGTPRHELTFVQRLNIAFDVACAVDYLHHQCQMEVIHCDLKPSNILLDAQMNGHVSDFGLAKIFPNAIGDLLVSQTSSIGLRGTIGYAPPGGGDSDVTNAEISERGLEVAEGGDEEAGVVGVRVEDIAADGDCRDPSTRVEGDGVAVEPGEGDGAVSNEGGDEGVGDGEEEGGVGLEEGPEEPQGGVEEADGGS